jgi:hypothetical protein
VGPWLVGDLGAPELFILLILTVLVLGGVLVLVVLTSLSVKRAADRSVADHDHQRPGDGERQR